MQRSDLSVFSGFAMMLVAVFSTPAWAHEDEPHGDHDAHHGGVVIMYKDLHFEVVLRAEGGVGVWFTDEQRNELPAVTVSDVVVEIEHADGGTEYPVMRISDAGDYWLGDGRLVDTPESTVRVGFLYENEPWMLDFPASFLMPETGRNSAMADSDAHAGH